MGDIAQLISKYGFPIVAAAGMGYMIFYVWTWATQEVKPVLSEANKVLIALIDRIRMLDNDLIRLNQKVNIVLQLRKMEHEELTKQAHEFLIEEQNRSVSVPEQKTETKPDKPNDEVKKK
jgi:hypothetical protein